MLLFCMARPCISNCMATRAYSACGVLAVPLPCASRAFAVSWWCNSAALLSWLCNVCAVPLPCICNVFAVLMPRSTACAVDCDFSCGVRSPFSHSLSRRRTCRVPRSLLRPHPPAAPAERCKCCPVSDGPVASNLRWVLSSLQTVSAILCL